MLCCGIAQDLEFFPVLVDNGSAGWLELAGESALVAMWLLSKQQTPKPTTFKPIQYLRQYVGRCFLQIQWGS
jgi:hypothetical protein